MATEAPHGDHLHFRHRGELTRGESFRGLRRRHSRGALSSGSAPGPSAGHTRRAAAHRPWPQLPLADACPGGSAASRAARCSALPAPAFHTAAYLLIIFRFVPVIFMVPSASVITSPVTSTVCVMCATSLAFLSAARSPVIW